MRFKTKEERLAYYKEMNERPVDKAGIAERWLKCGLLRDIPKEYVEECATALETQRLYNEQCPEYIISPQMKRISIPVIRRVFSGLLARDLDVRSECKRQPYWLAMPQLVFNDPMDFGGVSGNLFCQHNLDDEAELTAIVCEKICDELARKAKMNGKATIVLGPFTHDRMGVAQMNYGFA